ALVDSNGQDAGTDCLDRLDELGPPSALGGQADDAASASGSAHLAGAAESLRRPDYRFDFGSGDRRRELAPGRPLVTERGSGRLQELRAGEPREEDIAQLDGRPRHVRQSGPRLPIAFEKGAEYRPVVLAGVML